MEIAWTLWTFSIGLYLVTGRFPGVKGKDSGGVSGQCLNLDSLIQTSRDNLFRACQNAFIGKPKDAEDIHQDLKEASDCLEKRKFQEKSEEKCDNEKTCAGKIIDHKDEDLQEGSVTIAAAALIFLLGLALGLVTLTLVCVCCPTIHSKASSLRSTIKLVRRTRTGSRTSLREEAGSEVVDMAVYSEPVFNYELDFEDNSKAYNIMKNQPVFQRPISSEYNHLNIDTTSISGITLNTSKSNNPDAKVAELSYRCQGHKLQGLRQCVNEGEQGGNKSVHHGRKSSNSDETTFNTPPKDRIPAEEPRDYFVQEVTGVMTSGQSLEKSSPNIEGHDYFVLEPKTK